MSNYNSTRARQTSRITAAVDSCLQKKEKQLFAMRKGGWDAQRLVAYAGVLGGTRSVQSDNKKLAETNSERNIVRYATAQFKAANPAESVRKMAEQMANLEFKSTAIVAEKTLKELNFSTRIVNHGRRSAIEASRKGNAKLLVLIENNGAACGTGIKTDWANLSDKSCLEMQKEFEQKMAENGVVVSDDGTVEQRHMDPRGGQMISAAGKMHAADLATGILLYEESKEEYCQSLYYDNCGRADARKESI